MFDTSTPKAPSQSEFLALVSKANELFGDYVHVMTSEPVIDIIVARFEDETGQSLRQLASQLCHEVPAVERYLAPEDLILSAAAMREEYWPLKISGLHEKLQFLRNRVLARGRGEAESGF